MDALASPTTAGILLQRPASATRRLALAFVWLSFAASAIVFTEPAPIDVLMLGMVVLLPVIGLVRITAPLMIYLSVWLTAAACALIATFNAIDPARALTHTAITVFLALSGFVVAAFVMCRPKGHTELVLHASTIAGLVAATAGIVGYFDLVPGSFELFTLYARASGTFKDPNVFGPFLVAPLLYMFHRMLQASLFMGLVQSVAALVLGLGVLLSFSRGAWVNLAIAMAIFAYFAFVTAPTNRQRVKLIAAALGALIMVALVLSIVLQSDTMSDFLSERAALTQSYDEGPEGRFGGQEKARRLILENPFGLGAQQFDPYFHGEEAHNVYLSMFLNAGWLGGLIFLIMVGATCLFGFRHAFRRTETQALFLIAYACFVAHAAEGVLIDLDHWRHFHILMAIVWGLMHGDRAILTRVAVDDPRTIFEQPEMIVPSRPARTLKPVRPVAPASPRRRGATLQQSCDQRRIA